MAGSVNKVILIGNLGADPEIRRTQDGRPIANLRVATSESWRDKTTGERNEKTEWHRVVIFNEGLCKIVEQYLKKGSKVYLEGALQTRKWQDKEGHDKYSTEVVLQGFNSQLTMLDTRAVAAAQAPTAATTSAPAAQVADQAPPANASRPWRGGRQARRHGRRNSVLSVTPKRLSVRPRTRAGEAGPVCETISYRGKTYVLNSASPPVPVKVGVTVVGIIAGDISICEDTPLRVIKWSRNRMRCPLQ